jgi:hypothetical protein
MTPFEIGLIAWDGVVKSPVRNVEAVNEYFLHSPDKRYVAAHATTELGLKLSVKTPGTLRGMINFPLVYISHSIRPNGEVVIELKNNTGKAYIIDQGERICRFEPDEIVGDVKIT